MKTTTKVAANQVFKDPVLFLAFGFGSGLLPRAPGTAGTLAAVPLYLWFSNYPLTTYLSDRLGMHDHPGIVWDEFAGYLITMLPALSSWIWILPGFLLFRLFDIWKPWPITWVDKKVTGGLGIMLDDILAGCLAAVVLYMFMQVFG
jgi:phosphatidylglycerophosphatase A